MGPPVVYMIRHGEKTGIKGDENLDTNGYERMRALPGVFAGDNWSKWNIGCIIAQVADDVDLSNRPTQTVQDLVTALQQEPKLKNHDGSSNFTYNDKLGSYQFLDVANAVRSYPGPGNILICWEHSRLINLANVLALSTPNEANLVQAANPTNPSPYPQLRFDMIWTLERSGDEKTGVYNVTSMEPECTGLEQDKDFVYDQWTQLTQDDQGWQRKVGTTKDDTNALGMEKYTFDAGEQRWYHWMNVGAKNPPNWQVTERWEQDHKGDVDRTADFKKRDMSVGSIAWAMFERLQWVRWDHSTGTWVQHDKDD